MELVPDKTAELCAEEVHPASACLQYATGDENVFDNAIVIVDEVHNLLFRFKAIKQDCCFLICDRRPTPP